MSKQALIMWVVKLLVERLSGDDIKKWADMGLDLLENKIAASPSKIDDMAILPIIKIIREAFQIEDND